MDDRSLLIAGLDIALALLIVFLISFLAAIRDESAGPFADLAPLDSLQVARTGDFAAVQLFGVWLDDDVITLSEFRGGVWTKPRKLTGPDPIAAMRYAMAQSELPVVIYESQQSVHLGQVVREAMALGRPVGLARGQQWHADEQ